VTTGHNNWSDNELTALAFLQKQPARNAENPSPKANSVATEKGTFRMNTRKVRLGSPTTNL
jgi:hypothetical protein